MEIRKVPVDYFVVVCLVNKKKKLLYNVLNASSDCPMTDLMHNMHCIYYCTRSSY